MMKGRFLRDRTETKVGEESSEYYTERDLVIGRTLNVFGREMLLTDCDGQTKKFYRKKYGIEEFEPIQVPSRCQTFARYAPQESAFPPFNGWGSFEDSEGNCVGIEPKATPAVDFKKFIHYDK